MDLKLAEHDLEGKFKRFLGLGLEPDHFGYFNDQIQYFEQGKEFGWICHTVIKDEKDPLNRFDGLFNGRTYGEGRFVLIIDDQDDVFSHKKYIVHKYFKKDRHGWTTTALEKTIEISNKVVGYKYGWSNTFSASYAGCENVNGETYEKHTKCSQESIGNLHENPELYDKIK
jgi:hypothetical protein